MAISQDKAQELCSKPEWDTVTKTFAPRIEELTASVLKKNANRIRRFLEKEKTQPDSAQRVAVFEEALQRIEAQTPAQDDTNSKLEARRIKEKAARDKAKAIADKRAEVKTKLKEKADKEKAEKEGADAANDNKEKSNSGGVRSRLQDAGKHTQGKIGSRKV